MKSQTLFVSLSVLFVLAMSACAAPTVSPPATLISPAATAAPATVTPIPPTVTPIPPTVTPIPPTVTPIPPTVTPVPTLKETAEKIAAEMGKVMKVVEGDPKRIIFLFEERHDSRLGQMEIAVMLNRLYEKNGLKHIGLEGHPVEKGPLNLAWAHRQPYFQAGQKITGREDVIVYTLKQGEIGSAEMMGLIYADVVVDGIDDLKLYAIEVAAAAKQSVLVYLLQIATARMNNTQRSAYQALLDQKKTRDAFDFAVSTDKFTADAWARLSDEVNVISAEETLDLLDKIEQEAQKAGVKPTASQQANLKAMRDFLKIVSQRSDAMSANMLKVVAANPGVPAAMTVGVAHTSRLAELLTKAGVSFVVIRPLSLAEGSTAGLLSREAYQRKIQGRSVAPAGHLGALLEGRKKPEPRAEKKEYKELVLLKDVLQTAVNLLEEWMIQAGFPGLAPVGIKRAETFDKFKADLQKLMDAPETKKLWLDPEGIRRLEIVRLLDPQEYRIGGAAFQFTVTFKDGRKLVGRAWKIWKVSWDNPKPHIDLSDFLGRQVEDLRKETTPPPEPKPGEKPPPEEVCSNVKVEWETRY